MAECLDVLVLIERDDLIWIGSVQSIGDAICLIRNYSLKTPGRFVVYSRETEQRHFYFAEAGDVREIAKFHLNFKAAYLSFAVSQPHRKESSPAASVMARRRGWITWKH